MTGLLWQRSQTLFPVTPGKHFCFSAYSVRRFHVFYFTLLVSLSRRGISQNIFLLLDVFYLCIEEQLESPLFFIFPQGPGQSFPPKVVGSNLCSGLMCELRGHFRMLVEDWNWGKKSTFGPSGVINIIITQIKSIEAGV